MSTILFTVEGRRALLEHLKMLRPENNWLVAKAGFLDNDEGLPVTDPAALEILVGTAASGPVKKAKDPTKSPGPQPIEASDWGLIMGLDLSKPQRRFLEDLQAQNNKPIKNLCGNHKEFGSADIKDLNALFKKASLKYQLRFMTAWCAYKIVRLK